MSPHLKSIIKETQDLTQDELLKLMKEISRLLESKHLKRWENNDFWNPKTLDQLVKEQKVRAVKKLSDFAADFWPEDESVDDFMHYIDKQRLDCRNRPSA